MDVRARASIKAEEVLERLESLTAKMFARNNDARLEERFVTLSGFLILRSMTAVTGKTHRFDYVDRRLKPWARFATIVVVPFNAVWVALCAVELRRRRNDPDHYIKEADFAQAVRDHAAL